jgi:hypothetical protein
MRRRVRRRGPSTKKRHARPEVVLAGFALAPGT